MIPESQGVYPWEYVNDDYLSYLGTREQWFGSSNAVSKWHRRWGGIEGDIILVADCDPGLVVVTAGLLQRIHELRLKVP